MKKTLCLTLLLSASTLSFGQISKAQVALDENRIEDAKTAINKVLTPEAIKEYEAKDNLKKIAEAYNIAGNIEGRILNPLITKAQKGQPFDTTLFVNSLKQSIEYFTLSHRYDHKPNGKGVVKLKFYQNNHKMLRQMLRYPAYAGQFLYSSHKYADAYDMFDFHLRFPRNPIFRKAERDSLLSKNKQDYSEIAFYTSVLAFQELKDPDKVLAHIDLVTANPEHADDGYLMKTAALLQKKDTAAWENTTKEAIEDLPDNATFAQNLLYYYMTKNSTDEALAVAAELVEKSPENKMAWYANGCIKLNISRDFAGAREAFSKAIALDSTFFDATYNMGITYVNEVVSRRDEFNLETKSAKQYEAEREKILVFYRKALPYFEKARELAPDKAKVWAHSLKNIYYNLGDKDKEKEIDAILGE